MTDDITSDENQKGLSEVLNQGVVWIPPPSNYNFDDLEKALSEVYKKYPQMNTPSFKNLENRLEEFIERLADQVDSLATGMKRFVQITRILDHKTKD